jgi:RND family efflux transporter MFP subunit
MLGALLCAIQVRAQAPEPSGDSRPTGARATLSLADTVTVHAQPVTQVLRAYAQVQPIAPLPVKAVEAGALADMSVVPGSQVRAGQALATLAGAQMQSLLVSREAAVRSARSQLAAAERQLAIQRQQLSAQMSTRQATAAAQSAVAAAMAARDTAQAQLQVARQMRTLRAPSAGTVLTVNAAQGERVMAGQIVLTLQSSDRLWLAATYYGADAGAVHVGMPGHFQPASGGAPVAVKVVAVSGALSPDSGESVGLMAAGTPATGAHGAGAHAPAAPWLSGQRGTVSLSGPTAQLIAVPTRALILDQARWWVLLRTSQGIAAQAVVPGPTRGWQTFIRQGLTPGERVVVQNAYLDYHRGIAQRYTPPD